ncbi:ABC transporter ATP-binding protein [uncultured Clostridium sp.]|uniref:ABC transporter ATP-binding protein n=1 Tax=uncultured Clostridium sp. TaxID=59620 RepID=UPI00260A0FFA|nr:ABC transporter ATP-binding protein [uncultured Clostridium sp.]
MLRRFVKYYKPYKKLFILDLLAAFVVALCDLIYPMISRNIIDDVVQNKDGRMLLVFGITLLSIFILKAGLNYFMQYYGHILGVNMQGDMREEVFDHLQKLPNSYFNDNKIGVIMSRIINDLMEVSELAHHGPEDLFISVILLIGSFFILIGINVELTLIIFAILPLVIIFAIFKRKKMSAKFLESRVAVGDVNASLENSISGVRVTKAFCNHKIEKEKFKKDNRVFKKSRNEALRAMSEFFTGILFGIDILELVVLIVGGYFTYIGRITLGDFAAYLLYVKMFIQPIKKLVNFTEQFELGRTGFIRFLEIMDVEREIEAENPIHLKNVQGHINIKNVSFTYEDKKKVFKDLSLTIEKGKTVALVGPSGGGKTTLCNLIPRFFDYDNGSIEIDGVDINKVSLNSLRRNIGIVAQDVFLFTGTIKENILVGKADATDEEVIEACKKARIHEFIEELSEGYETFIGERGVKLSGGQKQRISIARIFLKNPPIIILDEATSALDNITEKQIQDSLEELSKDRTNIVVAHRLTTIKNADEIIVLTENGIEERGNHRELLIKGGIYASLNK